MSKSEAEKRQQFRLVGPLVLLILLVALGWAAGDRMQRLEFTIFDQVQQRVPAKASEQILLVDTGRAADTLWSDTRLPVAIAKLSAAGAAAIVPSQPPPAGNQMPDLEQLTALLALEKKQASRSGQSAGPTDLDGLSRRLAGFREQFEAQAEIHRALEQAGNAVIALAPTNPRSLDRNIAVPCQRLALSNDAGSDPLLSGVYPAREMLALPSSLCASAAAAGYAGFRPNLDGAVRENWLVVRAGDQVVPTLALAAVTAALPDRNLSIEGPGQLRLGEHQLSTGGGFAVLNRYYQKAGPKGAFETISIEELLAADFDSARAENRLVLLGPLAADPSYRTSLSANYPGMLLLATSMSNLLQADYAVRPGWLQWSELALLIALAATFVILVPGMTLNAAALAALFLATILLVTEVYLLLAHGIWARLGMAAVFSSLGIAAIHSLRYIRAGAPILIATPQPAMGALSNEDELDLAFSVLRQQAPNDDTKEQLYSIAVTHGRRREFAKAERVLRYLASLDPDYRGVQEKLKKLSGSKRAREQAKNANSDAVENSDAPKSSVRRKLGDQRTLGRYEVDKVIGRGAMATVYLGRDPKINRQVAIKTIALADEFSDDDLQAAKEQFMREAESAGRLNHANIISIYDVGEDNDVAYLAMEYFEGKSLHHFAQPGSLLPPQWVLELGARAAEALHYAHSQNVVHRDIKPANIMYNANNDELKLTDFGIARLTDTSRTKTGIILGTPSYMSPEQLAGNPVTGQSDLYSLGITLYHLMTGAPPFRADSIPKLMDKIVNERHVLMTTQREDLPACVDDIFDTALAKDPGDRFANGRAMALALRDCCSSFAD
jgi:serine/threonine-protein kinase